MIVPRLVHGYYYQLLVTISSFHFLNCLPRAVKNSDVFCYGRFKFLVSGLDL